MRSNKLRYTAILNLIQIVKQTFKLQKLPNCIQLLEITIHQVIQNQMVIACLK